MTVGELARQKTEELASEYRHRGYFVRETADAGELPEFLQDFRPDLVATSPAENVVIEIQSPMELDADRLTRMAEAVERQPGWRLEVVFVNQPVAAEIPSEEQLVPEAQVERLLTSAETLSADREVEAAAMLAWAAAEAVLRRHAQAAAPELERQSSARLLKQLYSLGQIAPATYEKLLALMQFRNAVAHGFEPRTATPRIPDVVAEIRRLRLA